MRARLQCIHTAKENNEMMNGGMQIVFEQFSDYSFSLQTNYICHEVTNLQKKSLNRVVHEHAVTSS